MKPGEPLYERFANQIEELAPQIHYREGIGELANQLIQHVRESGESIVVPRLKSYRTAIKRTLDSENVQIPAGKIYLTRSFENFAVEEAQIEGEDGLSEELEGLGLRYENKFLVQTSDYDESKGRFINMIREAVNPGDEDTYVMYGIVEPGDTPNVTAVESILYAVLRIGSGEYYGYTFCPNPNMGERITSDTPGGSGLEELLEMTDTCPIKAVPMDEETFSKVRNELEKAVAALVEPNAHHGEHLHSQSFIATARAAGERLLQRATKRYKTYGESTESDD